MLGKKEIKKVLGLSDQKRYGHFVRRVSKEKQVWSLDDGGWALSTNKAGQTYLPLWPFEEYAQLCVKGEWAGFTPKKFPLNELMDELLPSLQKDEVVIAVFLKADGKGIHQAALLLKADVDAELKQMDADGLENQKSDQK